MKIRLSFILAIIFAGIIYFSSCYRVIYNEDPGVQLKFSLDTLRFDTVFTTIGSATRILKVYNESDLPVQINEISVEKGEVSFFRFNIDGLAANTATNVEVPANDSIYIFGEVTVDPDLGVSASPFVIEDKLLFNTNGNEQFIRLEAWGQNANYIPNSQANGKIALLSCDLGQVIWDDPRPYVIYGVLLIDSCELVIPEGTNIYVHGGIVVNEELIYNDGIILVLKDGKLRTEGTPENPVIIQGDRLEESYQDIPGQWSGIRILDESQGNELNHTTIKNSIIGIRVDSMADLTLNATQIYNTSSSGLIGNHANFIYGKNSLIHSNGGNAASLVYGGNYSFDYCTFNSSLNQGAAILMRNYRCQDFLCLEPILLNPVSGNFRNCIIAGTGSDEIELQDGTQGEEPEMFQFTFENSLIRIDTLLNSNNYPNFFDQCPGCLSINNSDPLFKNKNEQDFHLDSLSQAAMRALPISEINTDLDGISRDPVNPDAGCYESEF